MVSIIQDKYNADPPFDYAQGRLFGDDNRKGKAKVFEAD